MAVYRPKIKIDDENNTKEVKIPYSTLADAPSLDDFTDKTNDQDVKGVWKFQNTNGLYANRIHNGVGNAVYDYDGTNVRLGSLSKPTHLRGSEQRPKYATGDGNTLKEIALVDDIPSTTNLAKVATSGSYDDLLNKPTIPSKTSELTNDSGFTANKGTITGIKMNGASKGTSGEVDLGTVLTKVPDNVVTTDTYQSIETPKVYFGTQYFNGNAESERAIDVSDGGDDANGDTLFGVNVSGDYSSDGIHDRGAVVIDEGENGKMPIEVRGTAGTAGQVLTSMGDGSTPKWANQDARFTFFELWNDSDYIVLDSNEYGFGHFYMYTNLTSTVGDITLSFCDSDHTIEGTSSQVSVKITIDFIRTSFGHIDYEIHVENGTGGGTGTISKSTEVAFSVSGVSSNGAFQCYGYTIGGNK